MVEVGYKQLTVAAESCLDSDRMIQTGGGATSFSAAGGVYASGAATVSLVELKSCMEARQRKPPPSVLRAGYMPQVQPQYHWWESSMQARQGSLVILV